MSAEASTRINANSNISSRNYELTVAMESIIITSTSPLSSRKGEAFSSVNTLRYGNRRGLVYLQVRHKERRLL